MRRCDIDMNGDIWVYNRTTTRTAGETTGG